MRENERIWPPLARWVCDTCGRLIKRADDGYVEWISEKTVDDNYLARELHIVHVGGRSSLGPPNYCFQHQTARGRCDLPLRDFLGAHGIVQMLSFLDVGPFHAAEYPGHTVGNMREFVELFRRTHLPYYEQARQYLSRVHTDDFLGGPNEIYVYLPDTLKGIIEEYADRKD